jgi:hypothetical protein
VSGSSVAREASEVMTTTESKTHKARSAAGSRTLLGDAVPVSVPRRGSDGRGGAYRVRPVAAAATRPATALALSIIEVDSR